MRGTIALVGAGEFLPIMKGVDRELLVASGGRQVAILPTASALDGPGVPERWGKMGVEHFEQLGAQAEAILALDRAACEGQEFSDQVRRGQPGIPFRRQAGLSLSDLGRIEAMAGRERGSRTRRRPGWVQCRSNGPRFALALALGPLAGSDHPRLASRIWTPFSLRDPPAL